MIERKVYADIGKSISEARLTSHTDRLLKALCSVAGPRPAGSRGISTARSILSGCLEKLGAVGITEEFFDLNVWHDSDTRLGTGNGKTYDCLQCAGSAGGTVSAGIDMFGKTDKERYDGKAVIMGGHVAAGGKFMPLSIRIRRAERMGASAVIISSTNSAGLPAVEMAADPEEIGIPVVSVSGKDGKELAGYAEIPGAKVTIEAEGYSSEGTCANLSAELTHGRESRETILLGAHLDSWWNSPGAFDNLTGVLTVMEIARILAPYKKCFERKLRVVFFTAEELLMLGSREYVRRHGYELDDISFMINMDSIFPATSRGFAVMWAPGMAGYAGRVFKEEGMETEARDMFCMSSDYLPFMLKGVPAARPADFENSFPDWSHTVKDNRDSISTDWIHQNAAVYAKLAARLLMDKELPKMPRPGRGEIVEMIKREGAAEALAAAGFVI